MTEKVRDTLRAALNVAIAQQVMPAFNPAAHVELKAGTKPKVLVWSDERIARWKETGEKPSPVMSGPPSRRRRSSTSSSRTGCTCSGG